MEIGVALETRFMFIGTVQSLPPHQPDRRTTLDGFWDPNMTNGERAAHATITLKNHRLLHGLGNEDNEGTDAIDLIANLLHLLHASGHHPIEALDQARSHFVAEAG